MSVWSVERVNGAWFVRGNPSVFASRTVEATREARRVQSVVPTVELIDPCVGSGREPADVKVLPCQSLITESAKVSILLRTYSLVFSVVYNVLDRC